MDLYEAMYTTRAMRRVNPTLSQMKYWGDFLTQLSEDHLVEIDTLLDS